MRSCSYRPPGVEDLDPVLHGGASVFGEERSGALLLSTQVPEQGEALHVMIYQKSKEINDVICFCPNVHKTHLFTYNLHKCKAENIMVVLLHLFRVIILSYMDNTYFMYGVMSSSVHFSRSVKSWLKRSSVSSERSSTRSRLMVSGRELRSTRATLWKMYNIVCAHVR